MYEEFPISHLIVFSLYVNKIMCHVDMTILHVDIILTAHR
jgi:hypothetical protein